MNESRRRYGNWHINEQEQRKQHRCNHGRWLWRATTNKKKKKKRTCANRMMPDADQYTRWHGIQVRQRQQNESSEEWVRERECANAKQSTQHQANSRILLCRSIYSYDYGVRSIVCIVQCIVGVSEYGIHIIVCGDLGAETPNKYVTRILSNSKLFLLWLGWRLWDRRGTRRNGE